ncbi:hypothetical protein C7446_2677 [Kushneria sinocarnis]|uniref:Secreted protein n=1 Tax=Kushneria sinocarnis TaxID=595502 RepID=A0A420WV03_9GAMM|nr:SIMPL domain-containing protein [Kushneria sinocarnis]RKQ97252.1 hypothetical protein C7446_2677 [Kushneria sinocarnis]
MRALPLTLLAMIGLSTAPLALAAPGDDTHRAHLEVQAQASVEVAPDRATLTATLWEKTPPRAAGDSDQGEALQQARQRLEQRTSRLLESLGQAGVSDDRLRAGSVSVQTERLGERQSGDDDNGEQRMRLSVERPITIDVQDLARIPGVVDALFAARVDRLDGISYDVADRDSVEDRALQQALERARAKARLMARTLGTQTGRVLSIEETRSPMFKPMMARAVSAESGGSNASYNPGTISVEAGVVVDWALDDRQR